MFKTILKECNNVREIFPDPYYSLTQIFKLLIYELLSSVQVLIQQCVVDFVICIKVLVVKYCEEEYSTIIVNARQLSICAFKFSARCSTFKKFQLLILVRIILNVDNIMSSKNNIFKLSVILYYNSSVTILSTINLFAK